MSETLQERLRLLREEAGISQEKLASALGVTRMTLAGYELGKRPPDSGFIVKVCQYFNCTPDYLFGISPFKNDAHYNKWISSSDTLEKALSLLPNSYREQLVAALNQLLRDNYAVNKLTRDKNYTVQQFIALTASYAKISQSFLSAAGNIDWNTGIDADTVFDFFSSTGKEKRELINLIENFVSDLSELLVNQVRNEVSSERKPELRNS